MMHTPCFCTGIYVIVNNFISYVTENYVTCAGIARRSIHYLHLGPSQHENNLSQVDDKTLHIYHNINVQSQYIAV